MNDENQEITKDEVIDKATTLIRRRAYAKEELDSAEREQEEFRKALEVILEPTLNKLREQILSTANDNARNISEKDAFALGGALTKHIKDTEKNLRSDLIKEIHNHTVKNVDECPHCHMKVRR